MNTYKNIHEMRNVLVTGGAGFIGSNFIRRLLRTNISVKIINLDLLTYAGNEESLRDFEALANYRFVHGDIIDWALVSGLLREHNIETVVHFAAESHVDRSIIGPLPFIETNVVGTLRLLEECRKFWLEDGGLPADEVRFHHVSTDEVYGSLNTGDASWTEHSPYLPNSPYSASKASSDHLVRAYGHTYGLPYTITNCSNNYGPYQLPEKFVPLVIVNGSSGEVIPVYGDGKQVRDWLYVEDHVEAIINVLEKGTNFETYNIGGGNQPTNLELVTLICRALDELVPLSGSATRDSLIKFVEDRKGHDRRYSINFEKISAEIGWKPKHDLEMGMRETVQWYINNPDWVKMVLDKKENRMWKESHYKKDRTRK